MGWGGVVCFVLKQSHCVALASLELRDPPGLPIAGVENVHVWSLDFCPAGFQSCDTPVCHFSQAAAAPYKESELNFNELSHLKYCKVDPENGTFVGAGLFQTVKIHILLFITCNK